MNNIFGRFFEGLWGVGVQAYTQPLRMTFSCHKKKSAKITTIKIWMRYKRCDPHHQATCFTHLHSSRSNKREENRYNFHSFTAKSASRNDGITSVSVTTTGWSATASHHELFLFCFNEKLFWNWTFCEDFIRFWFWWSTGF